MLLDFKITPDDYFYKNPNLKDSEFIISYDITFIENISNEEFERLEAAKEESRIHEDIIS